MLYATARRRSCAAPDDTRSWYLWPSMATIDRKDHDWPQPTRKGALRLAYPDITSVVPRSRSSSCSPACSQRALEFRRRAPRCARLSSRHLRSRGRRGLLTPCRSGHPPRGQDTVEQRAFTSSKRQSHNRADAFTRPGAVDARALEKRARARRPHLSVAPRLHSCRGCPD